MIHIHISREMVKASKTLYSVHYHVISWTHNMSQQPAALPHHIVPAAIHNLSVIRGVLQMPIKTVEKEASFVR